MTNEQILTKAIEKAVRNGWILPIGDCGAEYVPTEFGVQCCFDDDIETNTIIFSHSFAKAFWGEEELEYQDKAMIEGGIFGWQKAWRFHLQQMVLEEQPLQYLKKFI